MVAQHGWIGLNKPQIVQRWLDQQVNIVLGHLQGIQQLIVDLHHPSVEEVGRLLMLHNTKVPILLQQLEPLFQRPELYIFDAAGCRNNLDITD